MVPVFNPLSCSPLHLLLHCGVPQAWFRGSISSCFEAHLSLYVDLEERTLMEVLDKLIQVSDGGVKGEMS